MRLHTLRCSGDDRGIGRLEDGVLLELLCCPCKPDPVQNDLLSSEKFVRVKSKFDISDGERSWGRDLNTTC